MGGRAAAKGALAAATLVLLLAGLLPQTARAQPNPLNWRLDIPLPEKGCEFPAISLPDTEGETVSFNDFRGRPTLLAFCACYIDTGCHLLEQLKAVRQRYGDRLAIVVVCSEIAEILRREGFGPLEQRAEGVVDRILLDEEGRARAPFLVSTLPTTYLIDTAFCMRFKAVSISELNTPEFEKELGRVIGLQPHP